MHPLASHLPRAHTTKTTPTPRRLLRSTLRRLLFAIAALSLLIGSVTAQATETQLATHLSAQHAAHTTPCTLRCPLAHHHLPHRDLVDGWPYPLLPCAAFVVSA